MMGLICLHGLYAYDMLFNVFYDAMWMMIL